MFIIMSVESGIGVACGCLPGCKPLMNRLFPRFFGTANDSANQYPRRWRHDHDKHVDEEDTTQQSHSSRGLSTRPTSPAVTHSNTIIQPASLHRAASKQAQRSPIPSSSPSLSRSTSRTVNTNSLHPLPIHRSPSHHSQSTFTTTITAQPHLSRSNSRHSTRWVSADVNKPLPMRPPPPALASRRPNASGFRRSSRGHSRELSEISNASTELFILQGRDGGVGDGAEERRSGVWMG